MCLITTFGVNCPACDEYEDKKQTIEKCQFFKVNKKCMNKKYETKYEPQICGEYQEVKPAVERSSSPCDLHRVIPEWELAKVGVESTNGVDESSEGTLEFLLKKSLDLDEAIADLSRGRSLGKLLVVLPVLGKLAVDLFQGVPNSTLVLCEQDEGCEYQSHASVLEEYSAFYRQEGRLGYWEPSALDPHRDDVGEVFHCLEGRRNYTSGDSILVWCRKDLLPVLEHRSKLPVSDICATGDPVLEPIHDDIELALSMARFLPVDEGDGDIVVAPHLYLILVVLKLEAPCIEFLFVALVKLYTLVKAFTHIFNAVSYLKGNPVGAAEFPISPNRTVGLHNSESIRSSVTKSGITANISLVDKIANILVVGQNLDSAGTGVETSRDGLRAIRNLHVFLTSVYSYSGFTDGIEALTWSSQSWGHKHGGEQRGGLIATHD
ncbi:hypothetical protein HG530_014877 [Fusarium avenaceum]|nr:hypothetical protein HG530_014877 [Fusarium avenaceum]